MGSEFGTIWEDPKGGFIKFAIKRALKQDQTLLDFLFVVVFVDNRQMGDDKYLSRQLGLRQIDKQI